MKPIPYRLKNRIELYDHEDDPVTRYALYHVLRTERMTKWVKQLIQWTVVLLSIEALLHIAYGDETKLYQLLLGVTCIVAGYIGLFLVSYHISDRRLTKKSCHIVPQTIDELNENIPYLVTTSKYGQQHIPKKKAYVYIDDTIHTSRAFTFVCYDRELHMLVLTPLDAACFHQNTLLRTCSQINQKAHRK